MEKVRVEDIPEIFDEDKPLAEGILHFPEGDYFSPNMAWGMLGLLLFILTFNAIQALLMDGFQIDYFILAIICIAIFSVVLFWRLRKINERKKKLREGKWRYGTFLTRDFLIHRSFRSGKATKLPKREIRSLELLGGIKYSPRSFWFTLNNGKKVYVPITQYGYSSKELKKEILDWLKNAQ